MENQISEKGRANVHPMLLLFIVLILCTLSTYVIPAGKYETVLDEVSGIEHIDEDSFRFVERTPESPFNMLTAVTRGLQRTSDIIFFLVITGGLYGVVKASGAINIGVARLLRKFKNKEWVLIIAGMIILGIGSAFCGSFEEYLVFIPLALALSITAKLDSLTAAAVVYIPAVVGYAGGMTNTFTVGTAQTLAGVPMFSGIVFRWLIFIVLMTVSIAYVLWYTGNIKKNPKLSEVYEIDLRRNQDKKLDLDNIPQIGGRQILVIILFILGLIVAAVGIIYAGFYVDEMSAVFLLTAILCGVAAGFSPSKISREFGKGCKQILLPGMMIGLASAAVLVLEESNVMDSVMHYMIEIITKLPGKLIPCGMFIFHLLFNVIVPSGSAQAKATIPLMVPIADKYEISRQVTVIAYQLGDAFTNIMAPTGGEILATLLICHVPFAKWVKFLLPLFILWIVIAMMMIMLAVTMGI